MGVFDDDDEVAVAADAPAGVIEGDPDALTAVFDAFDAASDAAGDVFDDVVEGVAGTAADMAAKVEADFERLATAQNLASARRARRQVTPTGWAIAA